MLLIRTYPHGLTPYEFQFHVYDPDKATLHWFKRKTHALIHMANQNNGVLPSYATLTPDFIVADPDRTRTYRDGIYVFHGKLDLAVTNTLHFVKNTHATLKTVPYSKIEELALKNDVPLIGYPDDVEKDFSVVVSFFEQAVLAKNTRQGMYSTTEVVDLVRVYGCQHLGVLAPSHYLTTNIVMLAARYLGLNYREAGDIPVTGHRNESECNKVGAVFLPHRLPPTVFAYHAMKLYNRRSKIRKEPAMSRSMLKRQERRLPVGTSYAACDWRSRPAAVACFA